MFQPQPFDIAAYEQLTRPRHSPDVHLRHVRLHLHPLHLPLVRERALPT